MKASIGWQLIMVVELVGALLFLWLFYKLIVKFAASTSFVKRNLWKLALVGFCILAFFGINTLMFHLEESRDAELAQAIRTFNQAKASIEMVGVGHSKAGVFIFETDPNIVHFYAQDRFTGESAPCYIKKEKVYIFLYDSVSEPFIIYNSTVGAIDLYLPGDAVEMESKRISRVEWEADQIESEDLAAFLESLDYLEE